MAEGDRWWRNPLGQPSWMHRRETRRIPLWQALGFALFNVGMTIYWGVWGWRQADGGPVHLVYAMVSACHLPIAAAWAAVAVPLTPRRR